MMLERQGKLILAGTQVTFSPDKTIFSDTVYTLIF